MSIQQERQKGRKKERMKKKFTCSKPTFEWFWEFVERESGNELYKWYRPHAVVSSSLRKQQQVYAMRSLYIYIASLKYESDFHFSAKSNNNNKAEYISKLMSSNTLDL